MIAQQQTEGSTVHPPAAGPVIKMAGGKRQLLPEIRKHVPASFGRYFEPFVGGGAVFFDLVSAGKIAHGAAVLSDVNAEFCLMYEAIRYDAAKVVRGLRGYESLYREGGEAFYYKARAEKPSGLVAVATRLIFLNKTCFNGLYRVNRKGGFNVPHGDYKNPTICDEENLFAASRALRGVSVTCGDFEAALSRVGSDGERPPQRGDFCYFDPPYWPVSKTSSFVAYDKGGFGPGEQERLRDLALRLKGQGVHVLLSNADLEPVRKLYTHGFETRPIAARRNINSKGGKRGAVGELLIW